MMIPEAWVDDPAVMAIAGPIGLYFYLSANSYFREHAEGFADVGPWVKKGLVVAKFTHEQYITHLSKLGVKIAPKTSQRHLKALIDAEMVQVLQRGGSKHFPTSILAVGFWTAAGTRMKIVARGWLNRQGLNPEVRDELLALHASVEARRDAQREAQNRNLALSSECSSDIFVASDQTPSAGSSRDKNVASRSDKNVASEVPKTPPGTTYSDSPHTDVPIDQENTPYFLPAERGQQEESESSVRAQANSSGAAPRFVPERPAKSRAKDSGADTSARGPATSTDAPEVPAHKLMMQVIGEALYGEESAVPKRSWPRIAALSKELREETKPFAPLEVRTLLREIKADRFWGDKLSLNNLVDRLAHQRANRRHTGVGAIQAINEESERKAAEIRAKHTGQLKTFTEMEAEQIARIEEERRVRREAAAARRAAKENQS